MGTIKSKGYIQNKNTIQQIPEYNLRYQVKNKPEWGVQSPTDIDLVFEFQGKLIIMVEFKKEGMYMPKGQKRTLTTMIDAMQGRGKTKQRYQGAYLIVAEHNTPGNTKFFDGASCNVREMYTKKEWIATPKDKHTPLQKVIENIFEYHGVELKEYQQEFFNY